MGRPLLLLLEERITTGALALVFGHDVQDKPIAFPEHVVKMCQLNLT